MSIYSSVGPSTVRPGPALGTRLIAATSGTLPSRKRKDRDDPDPDPGARANNNSMKASSLGLPRPPHVRQPLPPEKRLGKPPSPVPQPHAHRVPPTPAFMPKQPSSAPAPATAKPGGNRLLMAGYLAHEFLSRGTLFGRPYGVAAATVEATVRNGDEVQQLNRSLQYQEVARILWGRGVHVPGVINPTQLGGWLQKQR